MSETSRIIALTVATAAVTSATLGLYYRWYWSNGVESDKARRRRHNTPREVTETDKDYPEELIREELARNFAFFGEEGMQKVRNKFIVVVGAGGVGSNCVASLARSGVSKIRIIDFDQVSLSSLNRHSVATLKDVGTPKVECLKNRLLQVTPWCDIEAIDEMFKVENADRLISEGNPDYVIDCIDNIDTKVDLLEYCYKKGYKTYCSMGASCKSDATRVNIDDISKTDEDPLARSVRRRLKKLGISTGITCVFSSEKPDPRKAKLMPLPDHEYEKGSVGELSALQNFRVRILPVLGTMPAIFGMTLSTWVITEAAGYPTEPIEGKNRYKTYDMLMHSLSAQESHLGNQGQRVPISTEDCGYLLEEVWRGKSGISGYSTRLALSRWNKDKPVCLTNLVIMTKEEQKAHEKRVLLGKEKIEDLYSEETIKAVEARFAEEQWYEQFR